MLYGKAQQRPPVFFFKGIAENIESRIDPARTIAATSLDGHSLGRSSAEKGYRRWALEHNLFVNPLTAIGPHAIAATDRMNLPSHVAPIGDPPEFIAWFNQMKQEYIAARWFLYEGTRPKEAHFVDHETCLVNTLDYPAFGIQVEKLRAAFRIAFGLLDKVAGFINAYYKLGMDPLHVNFRNVWRTNHAALHPALAARPNLAFRGLYWLAFDILGEDPKDQDTIAPEAAELKRLRDVLEHRSLVLREMRAGDPMGAVETACLADFEHHAMHILRLARVALMYLAFSMRKEESDRSRGAGDPVPGVELPTL
jgi:hypothetical protein